MKFQFKLVETFRSHSAKHARGAAIAAPSPYALGLATATEQELQRFAEHMEGRYARKVAEDAA